MKVCMVGIFHYLSDARVKGYAESLKQAGVMVDVLGIQGGTTSKVVDEKGVRVYSIPVHKTRRNQIRYLLEYSFSFLALGFVLTKLFLRNRYDIIHVHNMPDFLVFVGLIPKLLGAKIILDIHDPMPEVYLSKFPTKKGLGVALLRLEESFSTRFADIVITANANFKKNLIGRGVPASKITTINNFPDLTLFDRSKYLNEKRRNREYFTLIFPGTIAPRYGLDVAIRALPLIKKKIQNIKLLIIGRQDKYAKSLDSLANQLGVSSMVELKSGMPNDAIPKQLALADIGIYPALPDCHMSIATPGKLLEFVAMGIPIISSRLKIVEEMFDDSAVVFFEPGNENQFAQCVIELYETPSLKDEIICQADQVFAEKPSWEQEFQAYTDVLGRLLSEKKKVFE
ncbi:MAG: glycosyltransferase family 4 protein [Anaerolineae bacterium]|jgi:glycosyltransferase involved in cell wall biosynthesis|nr:glycosyltransferase family 4 protein [Anaerolineae bacterium]MBT4310633.1 glycosyltransferase family 4 protein [Anaerolineae bacterium]MBT4456938.1 glycosyltransferase family 4 protein [Anaerolineae bacterium]MBT4843674.1 glycosyltransferase family 4 protein [Anaerolineae bacterium]MBT6060334.1 glycosyltransferase family 4 protein [Anaerolineae bacterium]